MKISAFNGSPRGNNSNSLVILKWLLEKAEAEYSINNINLIDKHDEYLKELDQSDALLIVLPLYTDAMPAIVMKFFENLSNYRTHIQGKQVLYIVHSGFPEGFHSLPLKSYLENLSNKLNLVHYGVVIMGGSEGTRHMPPKMLRKKQAYFNKIGSDFASGKPLDNEVRQALFEPERFNKFQQIGFSIFRTLGFTDAYWDKNLKKNDAYDQRFATPYKDE